MDVSEAPTVARGGQTNEGHEEKLIGQIWGITIRPPVASSKLLEFYRSLLTLIRPDELVVRSVQDVVNVVNFVRDNPTKSLNALEAELENVPPEWLGPSTKASLELAIKLAFLVRPEQISATEAIGSAVQALFPQRPASKSKERIDHHFNALYLRKVGFNVMRTSYLSEHLLLDLPNKTIWVFEQTEFLKSYKNDGQRAVYPEGLLEETMETIKMLGAGDDIQILKRSFLSRNTPDIDIEMARSKPPSLDIKDYPFWGDKLVTLHEAYRKAKPTSLKQWWQDRRDSSQWTTFWLAVVAILLTLMFGLIQSITGVIQAAAIYHTGQPCASP